MALQIAWTFPDYICDSVCLFIVVAGHKVECIKYDVASQPVSIHVPVTRLLAGLYPLSDKFDIDLKQLHSRVCRSVAYN